MELLFSIRGNSPSLTILIISLTKSRLDISTLLSTKKKPCRESTGDCYFQTRQELAPVRGWK